MVRTFIESGVLLALAGILVGEFLVEGWLVPIEVSSGSMATTLLGPHRLVRCPDCGMTFYCDAQGAPDPAAAVCPNCGRRGLEFQPGIFPGDRLLIDRAVYEARRPRRWEVVLFHCPGHAGDYCIKRVVGLPGESIAIRRGDVYVNGAITRRSLAQQRGMAVLVYDTAWKAGPDNLPHRWSAPAGSRWTSSANGWQCPPGLPGIDWLTYVHWRRSAGNPPTIAESPVFDEDGYNQTVSRQLNPVTDLMLICRLSATGHGTLRLKARDGREEFQIALDVGSGAIAVARGGRTVETVQAGAGLLDRPTELLLSLIDRQIIVAIGGRQRLCYRYEPPARPVRTTSKPFAIGDSGLDVRISRLQIWRDVYYTPPPGGGPAPTRRLAGDEFYILGDNSPISRDSRPWTGGDVLHGKLVVGRLLRRFRRGP